MRYRYRQYKSLKNGETQEEVAKDKLLKCFWNKRDVRNPVTTELCALPNFTFLESTSLGSLQQSLTAIRQRASKGLRAWAFW